MSHILRLDADVISIENSKAGERVLRVFKTVSYSNQVRLVASGGTTLRQSDVHGPQIGPGVYDIHSPRVPSAEEMQQKISATLEVVSPDLFVVNPDCGLSAYLPTASRFSLDVVLAETRGWKETEASLKNLVAAARWARQKYN